MEHWSPDPFASKCWESTTTSSRRGCKEASTDPAPTIQHLLIFWMAWTGPCSDSFWAKPKCKGSKHPFWSLPLCFCKIDNFVHSSLHSCRSCSKDYHNCKIGNGVLRNCPLRACLRVAPVLQRALGSQPACRVSVKIFSESSIRRKTLQVSRCLLIEMPISTSWSVHHPVLLRFTANQRHI